MRDHRAGCMARMTLRATWSVEMVK